MTDDYKDHETVITHLRQRLEAADSKLHISEVQRLKLTVFLYEMFANPPSVQGVNSPDTLGFYCASLSNSVTELAGMCNDLAILRRDPADIEGPFDE